MKDKQYFLRRILWVIVGLLAIGVILNFSCTSFAASEAGGEYITVSVYDYTAGANKQEGASKTGVILKDYKIALDKNLSTLDMVIKAFTQNNISYETSSGFITAINGLGSSAGYAGWMMAYNNDDYTNYGISSITLKDKDTLRFDYTCNYDTVTDDIGTGWFGNPYLTNLEIGQAKITFSKEISSDNSTTYYQTQNGVKTEVKGDGTKDNPYSILIDTSKEINLINLTANLQTSLNEHYYKTTGLCKNQDFTQNITFTVSSLGGTYITYYQTQVDTAAVNAAFAKAVPVLTAVKADNQSKITITWKQTANADGYYIYRKSGNGWNKIASVQGNSTVKYSDTKVTTGTKYTYTVKAYRNSGNSALYSAYNSKGVSAVTALDTVTLSSVKSASYNSVKVTWKKAANAGGYYIYRKTGSKWNKIAVVKNGSAVTYTDKKLLTGTKYTYSVQAYCTIGDTTVTGSYNTKGVSGTPSLAAAKLGKVSQVKTGLKITWNKVSGASGYYVCRKSGNTFKKIGTIKKNSVIKFTDAAVKSNTKYTYTVIAYRTVNGKNIKASYSTKGISGTSAKK